MTITVTPNAADEVRKFMQEQGAADTAGLRVAVLPGGCSGFQYGLNIEDEPQDDDDVLDSHGIRLFVDPFSGQYLNRVEIDYVTTMMGSGFTFNNPNATGGCGCGSFVVEARDAEVIGDEAIWLDGEVVGWVTSGGYAHNSDVSMAMGYVPKEVADRQGPWFIELLGERLPARLQLGPIWDANAERMRG